MSTSGGCYLLTVDELEWFTAFNLIGVFGLQQPEKQLKYIVEFGVYKRKKVGIARFTIEQKNYIR